MSALNRLENLLRRERVRYSLFSHPAAISAQRTAQAEHVPGAEEAKVVIVRAGGRRLMAVLPATHHISLSKLCKLLEVQDACLENESELKNLFPDCETGAMPPFGHLYGLPVVVDRSLGQSENVVFNAGSHTEAIRMDFEDFERLAAPLVGEFTVRND